MKWGYLIPRKPDNGNFEDGVKRKAHGEGRMHKTGEGEETDRDVPGVYILTAV
jgi:hypothetical protein